MSDIEWVFQAAKKIEQNDVSRAQQHQNLLTKPQGSLGYLEDIAVRLSAMQHNRVPEIKKLQIVVFAADHGIAEEGVSVFPQAVTLEMVRNFARGGAAVSVLARQLGAGLEVVNTGTVSESENMSGVLDQRISAGTLNFSRQAAMSENQLAEALAVGREAVERCLKASVQLFIGGDMGIGNTTSATAIACVLLGSVPESLTGPGTGLDEKGITHKVSVIKSGLLLHKGKMKTPLDALRCVGGFEIAALTGAYLACAQKGLPVVIDGFISSVAALAAVKINSQAKDWMFFSHVSAEPGHLAIIQAMEVRALVALDMRLGEASGAATVVPLMRMACALHNEMATFEQAGVSNTRRPKDECLT
ncbi:Nicotinate-nucleotide--dimethylbenzimidazole phosphoribosyltransferase [hydrothermal vent metagenome]|uniref:Nicotinate-nucleotide--dimethylbenzimidazole phosphoribosyltransferase n=1 Tax=hydrothermal vent metagenome TaxID=652676 RepID=A0A3B0XVV5_9ZZZZ